MYDMKVLDINSPKPPGDIWEISHKLSGEYHGQGNDGYYQFEISADPDPHDQGGGYVGKADLILLTDWCIKQGAKIGDDILINHWW